MDMSDEYDFGSRYPIPFRVLFLSFATLFGFATNLHLLAYLGIDTALVLDVRASSAVSSGAASSRLQPSTSYVHPSRLFPPIYALALIGLGWTTLGWIVFLHLTGGDAKRMAEWRSIPAFVVLAVIIVVFLPSNTCYRKERMMFLRSLRRTMFSGLQSAVPFSDIILADILTSSAKVLGDVWNAGGLLFSRASSFGTEGSASGIYGSMWMVPIITSLPYVFRLRQCISEIVTGSTPTPDKSMLNALKYASAFPVIILSAMQAVAGSPLDQLEEAEADAWISKNKLFVLWVLAVLGNSLFSFWWDVTNDWGLSLLTRNGWSNSASLSFAFPSITPKIHTRGRGVSASSHLLPTDLKSSLPPPPSRPQSPGRHLSTPNRASHTRAYSTAATPNLSFPFLRPILLLPDPMIYYLAVALDLVLRFTWSLKLSSHLHNINEVESGIFMLEALEVVRRWIWVYLRIEWEAVRKGGGGGLEAREGDVRLRAAEEDDLAMSNLSPASLMRDDVERGGVGDYHEHKRKEEIGLGIS